MYHSTLLLLLGSVCLYAATIPSEKVLYRRPGSQSVGSSRLGIYQGNSTTIKKHPYIAVVTYNGYFRCAATIISENWVLLSGECVNGKKPAQLDVIVGSEDGKKGTFYSVKQVVVNPNYGDSVYDYDYALVQINGTFKWSSEVKKIALPNKNAKVGTHVVIAGWGDSDSGSDALQVGEMKVISLKQCSNAYSGFDITFTNRMGCLYNKGKTSPCENDSSDPVTKDNVLYYYFIGIASKGECTSDAYPAICANVLPAVPWIKKVTGIE